MRKKYKALVTIGSILSGLSLCLTAGLTIGLDHTKNTTSQKDVHGTLSTAGNTKLIQENNLTFSIENGQATLNGFVKPQSTLQVPEFVNYDGSQIPVTTIAPSAFANCGLQYLLLNQNLTVIGANAFANNELTSLKLPQGLLSIGANAFTNNLFHWGTEIELGTQTKWVKTLSNSSFGFQNNYSFFTPGIQTIVQGSAVYTQQPNQNQWILSSYLPSIGTAGSQIFQGRGAENTYHKSNDVLPTTQASYSQSTVNNIPIYFSSNGISNYAIWFFNKDYYSGWYTASIGFNPQTHHLIWNGIDGQFMNPGSSVTISIISGQTGLPTFTTTLLGTNNANSYAQNFADATFQFGDYITIQASGLQDQQFYVASNYDPNSNISKEWLNQYISCSNSWNWKLGRPLAFRITSSMLTNANEITDVNPVTCSEQSKSITVSGTSFANKQVTIKFGNSTFNTETNGQGDFSLLIPLPEKFSLSDTVEVFVPGSLPVLTHLVGNAPIQSGITLNLPGWRIGMLSFDGYTNTLNLGAYSQTFPIFNNPLMDYASISSIGGETNCSPTTLTFSVKNSSGQTTSTTVDLGTKENATVNFTTLTNEIDSIPFALGDTLTISSSNAGSVNVSMVHSLGSMARFGSEDHDSKWSFQIGSDGIKSVYAPPSLSSQLWNIGTTFWWTNHDNYINNNYSGQYSVGLDRDDWYNPNTNFFNVVDGITSAYSTDYAKAFAIMKWVHENMAYNWNNSQYDEMCGWSLTGQLMHLSGQCPTFAGLEAGMCAAAGMVARVINGCASGAANLNTWYDNQSGFHAWTQVWCPSIDEWITLDPTFGQWGGNIGDSDQMFRMQRNAAEVCVVIWPPHTNYFSYFKNDEAAALANLGQCFYVQQGSLSTNYPQWAAASFIDLIDKAMDPQTSGITWELGSD